MIALTDTPEDIYGKVMSWADSMMGVGFELCTDLDKTQAQQILEGNPRDAKMRLAFEITKSVYGETKATSAQLFFINTFQKKEIPNEIMEVVAKNDLAQTLIESNIVDSNSDIRRLVLAKAITHLDSEKTVSLEDIKKAPTKGTYKIGKNRFIKVV